MAAKTHDALVGNQFGPQASAYVASAVHAAGADLDRIEALLRGAEEVRVLDLGCGGGHVSYRLAPHVREVVAYDLSAEMLAAVRDTAAERGLGNIVTQAGSVEAIPFPAASFDVVVSRYSAHHWRDFAQGLREARRVLKAGGRAVFADAVAPGTPLLDTFLQSIELLRDPSHVRNYTLKEWRAALTAAGFEAGTVTEHRVPLDFTTWIARMRTPALHAEAIRSLQSRMAEEVTRHFDVRADGSFTLDTMTMEAWPV
ncbi:MAG TPA: class I SAM-dependent methyltransferase [Dongiaceae bacterium]|nr:class I SAM-dependent methyltransferase [Dongiaceae bacterium]